MQKSVLLLGNYPPPYGGVPTHIKYLADYLCTRDWNVQVVSFAGARGGVEQHAGYRVYRLAYPARRSRLLHLSWSDLAHAMRNRKILLAAPRTLAGWLLTANYVREVVRRHDIRLISAYHLLGAGTVGMWLSVELGLSLVTTVFGEIYGQTELHRHYLPQIRQVIAHSQRMVSCSHHCTNSFRLLGLDPRVEVVHYGIDTSRFHPENGGDAIRSRYGLGPDALVTLYVGRMVREMGLHVLLDAIPAVLRQCSQAVFFIVGTSGDLTPEARAVSVRYPGRVFVAPDVLDTELPPYYDACDLSVAPSINARACLGLAVAEAMATNKPVIGSRVGGTAEVLVDGETGMLVPPENGVALANAIVSLLHNPSRREQMGWRGRQRALTLFDKDLTNRRMEQIFEEVLA